MSKMSIGGSPTKTQFYSANGAGRDSYIWGNNGGFCPQTEPCKIEALGKEYNNKLFIASFGADLKNFLGLQVSLNVMIIHHIILFNQIPNRLFAHCINYCV